MSERPAKTRRIGSIKRSRSSSGTRISSKSKTEDDVSYLGQLLSRKFPDMTVKTHPDGPALVEMRGYLCEDDERCECFNLKINTDEKHILLDRVKYKYGDACTLSGTDVMTRLSEVFRTMRNKGVKYNIQLYDRARVKLVDAEGRKHEIMLSLQYIMLHGIPWYSKFGFRTPKFDAEVATNELTMNKPLPPQLLKKINAMLSPGMQIQKGTTFRQSAKMLEPKTDASKTLAFLELYAYLEKKLKYAYYDMWFQGTDGSIGRTLR